MTRNTMDVQSAQQPVAAAQAPKPAERKPSISSRISKYGKYDRLQG
ncbi:MULTISPECIES: hypothetical protein [unclassified Streptomyces]|nr:hypothetical protein [Streptomyces sp. DH41]MDG9723587.1 hypothetical protein [Streptomyces sp. DH41]